MLCTPIVADLPMHCVVRRSVLYAAVDCGAAPILLDSVPIIDALARTTYGATNTYRCVDGNWFGRDRYTETAACTAAALWESGATTDPDRMPTCIRKWVENGTRMRAIAASPSADVCLCPRPIAAEVA